MPRPIHPRSVSDSGSSFGTYRHGSAVVTRSGLPVRGSAIEGDSAPDVVALLEKGLSGGGSWARGQGCQDGAEGVARQDPSRLPTDRCPEHGEGGSACKGGDGNFRPQDPERL